MNELTESLLRAMDEVKAIRDGDLKLKKRENWPTESYYVSTDEEKQDAVIDNGNS